MIFLFIIIGFIFLSMIGFIIILFGINYKSKKYRKWLWNLKPGDNILVYIYSNYCECTREATVITGFNGEHIEAKIKPDCSKCAELMSKNDKGKITCWYEVTKFDSVYKNSNK